MQTLVRFISIVCNNHALQLFYGIEIDFSFQAELNFPHRKKMLNGIGLHEKAFRK